MPVNKGLGKVKGISRKGDWGPDRKRAIELICLKKKLKIDN
jgi:hypothetical protein